MSDSEAPEWSVCPECGSSLGNSSADVISSEPAAAEIRDGAIRVELECPECRCPLALEIASALPEGLGAKMSLERRGEVGE